MKQKTKTLTTILSASLLLALAGCGSDPVTDCITGDQALAALRTKYANIVPCEEDANNQTMIPGCPPGGTTSNDEPPSFTTDACAFKGDVGTCGQPPSNENSCNVMGRFTVSIFRQDPEFSSCTTKCFTPGTIQVENLHVGCNPPTTPPPPSTNVDQSVTYCSNTGDSTSL